MSFKMHLLISVRDVHGRYDAPNNFNTAEGSPSHFPVASRMPTHNSTTYGVLHVASQTRGRFRMSPIHLR